MICIKLGEVKIPIQTQEILFRWAFPEVSRKITEGSILCNGKTGYCKVWWEIAADPSNLVFGEGGMPRENSFKPNASLYKIYLFFLLPKGFQLILKFTAGPGPSLIRFLK